jgi:hypothetical protein
MEENGRVNQMEIYCINSMVLSRYLLMHFVKGPQQIKRCCNGFRQLWNGASVSLSNGSKNWFQMKWNRTERKGKPDCICSMVMSRYLLMHFEKGPQFCQKVLRRLWNGPYSWSSLSLWFQMKWNRTEQNGTECKGGPDRNLLYQFDGHA